jgi:hypothetical protein
LKNLKNVLLKNNTCIDIDMIEFYSTPPRIPYNATVLMTALAKCDANANHQ